MAQVRGDDIIFKHAISIQNKRYVYRSKRRKDVNVVYFWLNSSSDMTGIRHARHTLGHMSRTTSSMVNTARNVRYLSQGIDAGHWSCPHSTYCIESILTIKLCGKTTNKSADT